MNSLVCATSVAVMFLLASRGSLKSLLPAQDNTLLETVFGSTGDKLTWGDRDSKLLK